MKHDVLNTVKRILELGINHFDRYCQSVWMNDDALGNAFSDIPLKIEKYCETGLCIAFVKVDGITFKTVIKVTDLQAHNIKALKGAA